MRNAIKEFIEPSDYEKHNLWENAIFVFDTNVLLNLYRYSAKTRNSLLDAFLDSDSTVATEEGRSIAGDNIYQKQET